AWAGPWRGPRVLDTPRHGGAVDRLADAVGRLAGYGSVCPRRPIGRHRTGTDVGPHDRRPRCLRRGTAGNTAHPALQGGNDRLLPTHPQRGRLRRRLGRVILGQVAAKEVVAEVVAGVAPDRVGVVGVVLGVVVFDEEAGSGQPVVVVPPTLRGTGPREVQVGNVDGHR